MRYLLVGNAPVEAELLTLAAKNADIIIQTNDCRHAEVLSGFKTSFVFVINSGGDLGSSVIDRLFDKRELIGTPQIILVRNPAFYTLKKWVLRIRHHHLWKHYEVTNHWKKLSSVWSVNKISFFEALFLEIKLLLSGMPRGSQPSTRLMAYNWLKKRLNFEDSLDFVGFTFQGWEHHPWDLEKKIVRPIAGRQQGN